jgi:hypothetical protein
VRARLTVTDLERLIIDEQADQLTVGHVDDLPAGLREAVGAPGVPAGGLRQRMGLVLMVGGTSRFLAGAWAESGSIK